MTIRNPKFLLWSMRWGCALTLAAIFGSYTLWALQPWKPRGIGVQGEVVLPARWPLSRVSMPRGSEIRSRWPSDMELAMQNFRIWTFVDYTAFSARFDFPGHGSEVLNHLRKCAQAEGLEREVLDPEKETAESPTWSAEFSSSDGRYVTVTYLGDRAPGPGKYALQISVRSRTP